MRCHPRVFDAEKCGREGLSNAAVAPSSGSTFEHDSAAAVLESTEELIKLRML